MASSSSSATLRSRAQSPDNGEGVLVAAASIRCNCGEIAREATSWTSRNPARRFLGCPNYRDANRKCNFFRWVDPELEILYYKRKLHLVHEALISSEAESTMNAQLLEMSKRKLRVMRRLLIFLITISLIIMVVLLLCILTKAA